MGRAPSHERGRDRYPVGRVVWAVVMLWGRFVEWIDLAALAVGYVATCPGITVGFHRMLTRCSFQAYPAFGMP